MYAGKEKNTRKRVVISTWQSLHKMPKEYFQQFGTVFGDEAHLFKSKSLSSIMTQLTRCPYRIAMTGTLDGMLTHKLVIEGLFGPTKKVITTKKLMEQDLLSNLTIDCLVLNYTGSNRQLMRRTPYQDEIEWLITDSRRNKFICDLVSNLPGNTLILFNYVEKHGKPLYTMIENKIIDKTLETRINKGNSAWLIISDGSIAENQIDKNKPLKLGYDKWTNNNYSNKEFIINKVHEFTINKAFINSRKKTINNLLVDKVKLSENIDFWKYSSILYPIVLSLFIYFILIFYRKTF